MISVILKIQYSIELIPNIEYYSDKIFKDYYSLGQYYFDDINEKIYSKCINSSFEQIIAKCNFKKRLQLCNIIGINKTSNDKDTIWYVLDWRETSKYLELIFGVYLNPILAFICIVTNILTIRILSSKCIKKEIKTMYSYLKMYTISNLICIILVYFDLLTKCLQDEIFCSSVSNSIYVQYINTHFVKWLKGSLITFSNITYTSFILARYIQVSDTKNEN